MMYSKPASWNLEVADHHQLLSDVKFTGFIVALLYLFAKLDLFMIPNRSIP